MRYNFPVMQLEIYQIHFCLIDHFCLHTRLHAAAGVLGGLDRAARTDENPASCWLRGSQRGLTEELRVGSEGK